MRTSIHETGFTTVLNKKKHNFSILDCFVIQFLCHHAEDVGAIAPVMNRILIDEASGVFNNIENIEENIEETKEDFKSLGLVFVREIKDEVYVYPTKECLFVGSRLQKHVEKHAPVVIVGVPLIQPAPLYIWSDEKPMSPTEFYTDRLAKMVDVTKSEERETESA